MAESAAAHSASSTGLFFDSTSNIQSDGVTRSSIDAQDTNVLYYEGRIFDALINDEPKGGRRRYAESVVERHLKID